MSKGFILLLMIFCHIVADYNLQGWLASAKQKSFWEENAPDPMYKYDYICALMTHSFAWTFMMMLPVFYIHGFSIDAVMAGVFTGNIICHFEVDNAKANDKIINLWQDQLIHLVQILATMLILVR